MVSANLALVEVFLLMSVVYALTRKRTVPDMAARAPERVTARRETLLLVAYGIFCQLGGLVLGRELGGHAFSFHVVGSLFGTHQVVEPTEVLAWATYNLIVYALVPYRFLSAPLLRRGAEPQVKQQAQRCQHHRGGAADRVRLPAPRLHAGILDLSPSNSCWALL